MNVWAVLLGLFLKFVVGYWVDKSKDGHLDTLLPAAQGSISISSKDVDLANSTSWCVRHKRFVDRDGRWNGRPTSNLYVFMWPVPHINPGISRCHSPSRRTIYTFRNCILFCIPSWWIINKFWNIPGSNTITVLRQRHTRYMLLSWCDVAAPLASYFTVDSAA